MYSGLLTDVTVDSGKPLIENLTIAYKFGRSLYKDTSVVFTEAHSICPKMRQIAIYYADPSNVDQHVMQWAVGNIIAESSQSPDEESLELFKANDFKIFQLPKVSNVVYTKFPNTTPFSVFIGVYKIYHKLAAYVQDNNLCAHPWIEIYDENSIYYLAPLSKQSEFYVPETKEDIDSQTDCKNALSDSANDDIYPDESSDIAKNYSEDLLFDVVLNHKSNAENEKMSAMNEDTCDSRLDELQNIDEDFDDDDKCPSENPSNIEITANENNCFSSDSLEKGLVRKRNVDLTNQNMINEQ